MESDDLQIVQLELKYCEYCGGLWLRQKGDREVYCATCIPYVAQLAVPNLRRSRPRTPVNTKRSTAYEDVDIFICGEGGNA